MDIPTDLRYTDQHEWLRIDGDSAVVGITDFAQQQLGDMTYVEPPEAGRAVAAGDPVCALESCKAAADVYAPLAGEVVAGNAALDESPELVNEQPYGEGWMFRLKLADPQAVAGLMDAAAYAAFCEQAP